MDTFAARPFMVAVRCRLSSISPKFRQNVAFFRLRRSAAHFALNCVLMTRFICHNVRSTCFYICSFVLITCILPYFPVASFHSKLATRNFSRSLKDLTNFGTFEISQILGPLQSQDLKVFTISPT